MSSLNLEPQNRREFLHRAVRLALLAGVGALGLRLFRRESLTACINDGVCGNCHVFGQCGLPPAQAARRAEKGSGRG